MPFNGSGVATRVHDWTTDLAGAIPVTASRMDAEHDDIATMMSNTICRDGQSTTTARIPFAQGTSTAGGSTASVAYAQTNDLNTGLYFPATDQWGLVAGGTAVLTGTSSGVAVTGTLTTSGALTPSASDGAALGSASVMWSDLFLASGGVINWNNGDVTVTHSANSLVFQGASNNYSFDASVTPTANDGAALGSTAVMWSDLFLASGAVINFNNGDVTVTHSADTLTVAGGAFAASGNATVGGTLGVTGAATLSGTLAVTGASTLTGALTANNSAGVAAKNTVKAFVYFTTDGSSAVTIQSSFNVSGITVETIEGGNGFRISFTNALPSANYASVITGRIVGSVTGIHEYKSTSSTTALDVFFVTTGAARQTATLAVDIIILDAN